MFSCTLAWIPISASCFWTNIAMSWYDVVVSIESCVRGFLVLYPACCRRLAANWGL